VTALITGISGQDGTLLAELLHARGVEVVGVCRGAGSPRSSAVARMVPLDLRDGAALRALVAEVRPDECYHLAAYHRSSTTVDAPADEERAYLETNLYATHTLLDALRAHRPDCRVFLAGSCHMFGDPNETPQNEDTPFRPTSLYGITKVASAHLGHLYRAQHGLFCATGILYNHESPLRGPGFVTQRIVRGAVAIARGRARELTVGDPDARVDWGWAADYVDAMRLMLAADAPEDFVIASGDLHSVREFATLAFARLGLDADQHLLQDPAAHRPVSRAQYFGDISRIRTRLGWSPSTPFAAWVSQLVDAELSGAD
jgi:GDPmannose 4,6-dehydratase